MVMEQCMELELEFILFNILTTAFKTQWQSVIIADIYFVRDGTLKKHSFVIFTVIHSTFKALSVKHFQ